MGTVAVVSSRHADENWIFRAVDARLVVVDAAAADVIVVADDCLAGVVERAAAGSAIVVIGDPTQPHSGADFVIDRDWADDHVRSLLIALATKQPLGGETLGAPETPAEARDAQRAVASARKLGGTTDLLAFESATQEISAELLGADRACCLYYQAETASLWSEVRHQSGDDDRRATTGLVGFAARTGVPTAATHAASDPRFVPVNDDPQGERDDHIAVQPMLGSDGAVHAVLVIVRRGGRLDFTPAELQLLRRFAQLVTPLLDQLSIQVQSQAILDENEAESGIFRREAVEAQAAPRWGDVIRVSPSWLSWAYWLLVALLVGSSVFVAIGRVSTYSSGPAVIRSTARIPVAARIGGNIVAVAVTPDERVEAGGVIARLDDSDQRAAVERLTHEFETQLRNHMLDLSDASAESALRDVRHQLDAARSALGERLIRAPITGVVGDVRVRPSQHVEAGDVVASVVENRDALEVIALLPGEDRPQLAPGMRMRVELMGYRYAYQTLAIDSVSPDVMAPGEARRVLGADVADGLKLDGPVVIVRGRLPTSQFTVDDRLLRYHDGMFGTAEVRVRQEPIINAIVPGVRTLR